MADLVNLTSDELDAAIKGGLFADPAVLDKLDADTRQRAATAMPGPKVGAPPADRPVTLGDLKDDPAAAMQRIGQIVKKDVSDPRLWLSLAASYFAPKVFNLAGPIVARAATGAAKGLGSAAGAALDMADPDLVSIASPRAGAVLKKAQQVRDYMATRPAAPEPAPPTSPVETAPVSTAAQSVDTPPPPPASAPKFPAQKALNDLAIQARRQGVTLSETESQAGVDLMRDQGASAEDVVKTIASSRSPSGLTLSAEEQALVTQLRTSGKSGAEAEAAILKARSLAKKLKTPASGAVDDAVRQRNQTGRWED